MYVQKTRISQTLDKRQRHCGTPTTNPQIYSSACYHIANTVDHEKYFHCADGELCSNVCYLVEQVLARSLAVRRTIPVFKKKTLIVLPLIINFHFLNLDGSSSIIQTCYIAAMLFINSCFCHQYLPMAILLHDITS